MSDAQASGPALSMRTRPAAEFGLDRPAHLVVNRCRLGAMRGEQMTLPVEYGVPSRTLDWAAVVQGLADSDRVWLATTRPDGRPHVVPVDGLWLEGAWYFGGSEQSVHVRNLRHNPAVVMHLSDTMSVVIAEGRAEWVTPPLPLAKLLAAASKKKYGYAPSPQAYLAGLWCLRPQRVLAWQSFPQDATRFRFA